MKLPRWLVIGLLTLSGLTVLGSLSFWWVVWPETTCQAFLAHCAASEWSDAKRLSTSELSEYLSTDPLLPQSLSYREQDANWPIPTLAYNPKRDWCRRTISEVLTGKQRITARGAEMKGTRFTIFKYELTARFGEISCERTGGIIFQD